MKRDMLSVLILIPNALQCDLIKMTLLRNQMSPVICDRPEALHQQLLQAVPDVLLIDTHLPGHNGLDLVSQLHFDVLLRRTKVIFVSSLGFPEVVQRAAQIGASGFLVKPIDPDLLVSRIQNCFRSTSPSAAQTARVHV